VIAYSLVKFNYKDIADIYYDEYFEVFGNEVFVFLGEIVQMPGHCIVVGMKTGKVISGYHTGNFKVLTEDEC